jgi:uncharacterized Tic20 family protein
LSILAASGTLPAMSDETSLPQPTNSNDKTMGMVAHLIALAGYVIPFGNIIGPLIIWLTQKETSPFAADQGKESLNFQITVTIALLLSIPLWFICIGIFVTIAIAVVDLILIIVAAVQANNGTAYRYPFCLRLVK